MNAMALNNITLHNVSSSLPLSRIDGTLEFVENFDDFENWTFTLNVSNYSENFTFHFSSLFDTSTRDALVIFFYSLIIIISIFGNTLVCRVVFKGSAMRSTTNLYIGNLSLSDLMMTVLNIPLQVARIMLNDWPFGKVLCCSVPFISTLSVNVSTFTMAFIALDRHQVITNPLKPRPSHCAAMIRIGFIWIFATIVSLPYSIISDVVETRTYVKMKRCHLLYPPPRASNRMWFTIVTFVVQYIIPLTITAICYAKIACIVWYRRTIGVQTENQRINQQCSKWKTIKMLMIVVLAFATCWLPFNVYHLYQDTRPESSAWKHNSSIFFACHWFAMSSVCYNPFIYCWLNDSFRKVVIGHFKWIGKVFRNQRTIPMSPLRDHRRDSRGDRDRYDLVRESTIRTMSTSLRSQPSITTESTFRSSLKIPFLKSKQQTSFAQKRRHSLELINENYKKNGFVKRNSLIVSDSYPFSVSDETPV